MTSYEYTRIASLFKQTERNIEITSGNTRVRLVEDGEYVYGFEAFSNNLETTYEFDWDYPDPLTDESVTYAQALARILDGTKRPGICDAILTHTHELDSLADAVNKLSDEEWLGSWKLYDYEDFGKELLRRKLNGVPNAERIIEELDRAINWKLYVRLYEGDETIYEIFEAYDVLAHW